MSETRELSKEESLAVIRTLMKTLEENPSMKTMEEVLTVTYPGQDFQIKKLD